MHCLDYFTLMPVFAEVHIFPVCILILCSKVIFSLCLCIFYSGISEATHLEGKLAANASCIREGGASSWLATLAIAKHRFALRKGAF